MKVVDSFWAQVGTQAYLKGAPSFVLLEPGFYIPVKIYQEATETLLVLKKGYHELPPLVYISAAGRTKLGNEFNK